MEEGRGRVLSWPLNGDGWDLIGPGLQRTYRRRRKRLRDVEGNATVTNLHEWRKRVKDLWYQLRLIRRAEPELFGHLVRDADDLADHLGVDHDLALLRDAGDGPKGGLRLSRATSGTCWSWSTAAAAELQFAATTLGRAFIATSRRSSSSWLERRWR